MESIQGLYERQIDVFNPDNPEHQKQIIMVGAGTIGSWLGLALCKLGVKNLRVIDNDSVELHNVPNQVYPQSHISKSKISALASITGALTSSKFIGHYNKFGETISSIPLVGDVILVSAVDNMATRKEMFEYAKTTPQVKFFIDGRMAGQVFITFTVDMFNSEQVSEYEKSLYSDDSSHIKNEDVRRASDVPCTAKSIVDVSMMIAGKMCGAVRKCCTGGKNAFEFTYDAKNDVLISESL